MRPVLAPFALFWALFATTLAVVGLFLPLRQPKPNLSPYITKASVGSGTTGALEAAQDRIRQTIVANGLKVVSLKVVSEKFDGNLGTVVVDVAWDEPDGTNYESTELTVQEHRTVWSVGQITPGSGKTPKS